MSIKPKHEAIAELLGAFALDACEPDEVSAIDVHLRDCPRCRAELAEFQEAAALLAHTGADAPVGVWESIVAGLGEAPAPVAPILAFQTRTKSKRARWAVSAIGLAAAIAIGANSALLLRDQHRITDLRNAQPASNLTAVALAASTNPLAHTARLRSAKGSTTADAVVLPDGSGYVLNNTLAPLDVGHTYQLWAVTADGRTAVSLGVLGSAPKVSAFTAKGPIAGLAITIENAGGARTPAPVPLLSGELVART